MKRIVAIVIVLFLILTGALLVISDAGNEQKPVKSQGTRATLIVGPGQTYTKIQNAVDAASAGDTIQVWAGTYYERVTINKTVTLLGNGSTNTVINGSKGGNVLTISANNCEINGFRIEGSSEDAFMGGVRIDSFNGTADTSNNLIINCNATGNNIGFFFFNGSNSFVKNCSAYRNQDEGFYLSKSHYNRISNCTIMGNGNGIGTEFAEYNSFADCYLTSNYIGIDLRGNSKYNTVLRCNSSNNYCLGGRIQDDYNTVDNSIFNNNGFEDGLYLFDGQHNTIKNSVFNSNLRNGIWLYMSNNNNIFNISAEHNADDGLNIDRSSNNEIQYSVFGDNGLYGISMESGTVCSGNSIHHNNFLNNGVGSNQGNDPFGNNNWNTSFFGNYWSDHTTPDNDSNGIVDVPYIINGSGNAKDYFPLASPVGDIFVHMRSIDVQVDETTYFLGEDVFINFTNTGQINLTANWPGFVIKDETNNTIYETEGVPTVILDLGSGETFHFDPWTQQYNNGTQVPPGTYHAEVTFDGCNDSVEFEIIDRESLVDGRIYIVRTLESFPTIQEAVDSAIDGDTIRVFSGTYYETIHLNKSISLVGNGSADTIINGSYRGDVITINAHQCNVSGFTVTGASDYTTYLFGLTSAILLNSYSNSILDCTFVDNEGRGISLDSSQDNVISNCVFRNNLYGIYLINSINNTISGNLCEYNLQYFYCTGIYLRYSDYNIVTDNICDINPTGIMLYGSNYTTLVNNSCSGNNFGIEISYSSNCDIEENKCNQNAAYGLYISNSVENQLSNNEMVDCGFRVYDESVSNLNSHSIDTTNTVNGDPLYYWTNEKDKQIPLDAGQVILVNCSRVQVKDLVLFNTSVGVSLLFSDSITMSNLEITNNGQYYTFGIHLFNSFRNDILSCVISNSDNGIYSQKSGWNNIENCMIKSNQIGIYFIFSHNTTVINTTFDSNVNGVEDYLECYDFLFLDNIFSNNDIGCRFAPSEAITKNDFTGNRIGLLLSFAQDVSECYFSGNEVGIYISSPDSTVSDCIFSSNEVGVEINGYYGRENTIEDCLFELNYGCGVLFNGSNENLVQNNIFESNIGNGIDINGSTANLITNNQFRNNSNYGVAVLEEYWVEKYRIYMGWGHRNSIYLNNFINNNKGGVQAFDGGKTNRWNTSEYGNYWDDWTTPDSDGDGIVDTPYYLDVTEDYVDHYPLTEPFENYITDDIESNNTDEDGLPDEWEEQYFGNLSYGPDDDFDGDGYTNLEEYEAGTDPTDPNQYPGIDDDDSDNDDDDSAGINSLYLIGGAIGLAVLVTIIIAVILIFVLRRKQEEDEPTLSEERVPSMEEIDPMEIQGQPEPYDTLLVEEE